MEIELSEFLNSAENFKGETIFPFSVRLHTFVIREISGSQNMFEENALGDWEVQIPRLMETEEGMLNYSVETYQKEKLMPMTSGYLHLLWERSRFCET